MDDGMLPAHGGHQHVADGRLIVRRQPGGILTKRRQLAGAGEIKDRRLHQDLRGWVCRQQGGQVLRIEMIGMLVGHQHRIKIGQGMPGVGEVPRIDENPGAVGLGEDSRMPEVGDPHCTTVGQGRLSHVR